MRVLYVESAYGFGGSLTGLLHLLSAMPAAIEPVLITCFDPAPYVDMPCGLVHRKVAIHERPPQPGSRMAALFHYWKYSVLPWYRAIDRAIIEFHPELIHTNNSATINLGAGLAGYRRGVPTVSHQKHFEYPERLSRTVLKRSCYSHHIATSDSVAAQMCEFGLSASQLTRMYEPVAAPTDEHLSARRNNTVPVVAMHSMLVRWKGQHIFLSAVDEVRKRCAQPFRVVIAGGPPAGDTSYADELRSLAIGLGLGDLVEFRGHVRNVYEFLLTIDVAVHAAVSPEPFGRVAAEAMLCGLPNVVTIGGGPAEYVRHGSTGLHVPCNDVSAMANAIQTLIVSPDLRQQMGKAAREDALRAFDPELLAQQTVALYRQVLSKAGAAESNRVKSAW